MCISYSSRCVRNFNFNGVRGPRVCISAPVKKLGSCRVPNIPRVSPLPHTGHISHPQPSTADPPPITHPFRYNAERPILGGRPLHEKVPPRLELKLHFCRGGDAETSWSRVRFAAWAQARCAKAAASRGRSLEGQRTVKKSSMQSGWRGRGRKVWGWYRG